MPSDVPFSPHTPCTLYHPTPNLSILRLRTDIRWLFSDWEVSNKIKKIEEEEQQIAEDEDEVNGIADPGSALSTFNDRHCLLSGRLIEQPHQSIRCGRCCGVFHLDALFEISYAASPSSEYAALLPVLILPTKEVLEQQPHEEWFCPFCLLENTTNRTHRYQSVLCSIVWYSTVQYSTVQYSTVQYSAVLYSTVQCSNAVLMRNVALYSLSTEFFSSVFWHLSPCIDIHPSKATSMYFQSFSAIFYAPLASHLTYSCPLLSPPVFSSLLLSPLVPFI
jgi:hypothetical protein